MHEKKDQPVLVTGATGYVAGRLIPLLLSSGYRVRAMGRSIEKMAARPWGRDPGIELVAGDIMDLASLDKAVAGCGTIYYLVHSMISRKAGYRDADRTGAAMIPGSGSASFEILRYLAERLPVMITPKWVSLPTVCTDHRIRETIPQDLLFCGQAIERALDRVRQEQEKKSDKLGSC